MISSGYIKKLCRFYTLYDLNIKLGLGSLASPLGGVGDTGLVKVVHISPVPIFGSGLASVMWYSWPMANLVSMEDKRFMRMALRLARKGLGRTSPNPAVGAVVVRDGVVVGRGYHQKAGGPHAEANALEDAGERARGGTLYVTLEPCNHQGRTPPCTEAVLRAGIRRVVIGVRDPNPRVKGGGADFLRAEGLVVDTGCLELEARKLIAPFVKHTTTGLPWIRTKVAASLDGKIATHTGESRWITGEKARAFGHMLRDISCAIMVGRGTVEHDDPSLTCRLKKKGSRDPIRVILDSSLSLPPWHKVFTQASSATTMVFCDASRVNRRKKAMLEDLGVQIIEIESTGKGVLPLKTVLKTLGRMGIQSVLVEGGAGLHGSFFDENLVDEAFFFYAPNVIGGAHALASIGGGGVDSPTKAHPLYHIDVKRLGPDLMVHGFLDKGIYDRCLPA